MFVCLAVLGAAAWRIAGNYGRELAHGDRTTVNLARSLSDHAVATVTEAEIVLSGLAGIVSRRGTEPEAVAFLHRSMMESVASWPILHHLVLFSASGDAQTASFEPDLKINVIDRDYFAYHRDHVDPKPLVSPPSRNKADGHWSIMVSRRVEGSDGAFAGVVVAVIDCATFLDHYATFDVGPHGTITLLHASNRFIVRYPEPANPEYRAAQTNPSYWPKGEYSNVTAVSPTDGVERSLGMSRAGKLPLLVIVALSRDDMLAGWRRDSATVVVSCVVFLAIIGLLAWRLARQIRQQAHREQIVRRSEERYRMLAEHSDDVIVKLDATGRRQYVSPSSKRLLGYQPHEMLGGAPRDIAHPDDLPVLAAELDRCVSVGHAAAITSRLRCKDGTFKWVESVGKKVDDGSGYVYTLRDASSRKQAEAESLASHGRLEAANGELERLTRHLSRAADRADAASRAKSRFLANMSHELRTPLNGILGYTHLLRLDGGLTEVQASRLDAMLTAGSHLLAMINRVLDLSEVESHMTSVQAAAVDPAELGQTCLAFVRPSAESKGLALAFQSEMPAGSIQTDPMRLRQVLLNLLGNAVKFTTCGSVTLRMKPLEGAHGLRAEVVDTGRGIAVEERHRLFTEFERIDSDHDQSIEGAGLGLALSARLMASLGGVVGFDENPAGGSVFWLELPTASPAIPCSAPSITGSPAETTRFAPACVLVVDDMAINRDVAASILRTHGHRAVCAESGADAVGLAASSDFDLILMDVRMPGMDGLEATRTIRALAGSRGRVPVIALTAQAFTNQIAECLQAGMEGHLAKPFTPDALLSAVAAIMGPVPPHPNSADHALQTPSGVGKPVRNGGGLAVSTPVWDPADFARISAMLSPTGVSTHLAMIERRATDLLKQLRQPPDPATADVAGQLVEEAHELAGSAAMFGFRRLCVEACTFEHLAASGAASAAAKNALGDVIEVTVATIQAHAPPVTLAQPTRSAPVLAVQ